MPVSRRRSAPAPFWQAPLSEERVALPPGCRELDEDVPNVVTHSAAASTAEEQPGDLLLDARSLLRVPRPLQPLGQLADPLLPSLALAEFGLPARLLLGVGPRARTLRRRRTAR